MKKFRLYVIFMAATAFLFTYCSKEEDAALGGDEKTTLSFGAVLNDLVNRSSALKQQLDIPECSDDAPAFVDIVLSGTTEVGSVENPLRVTVNVSPSDYDGDGIDEYFTHEHPDLELDSGSYTLEWFVVRNANLEIIWVAPVSGGDMAKLVNNPLPLNFSLSAGTKEYVDVEVLCFDDREVNAYGYSFFDLETNEFFEYCFFVNVCDENGRHYPAAYSVDILLGSDPYSGEVLYSGILNTTGINSDGEAFAEPLCFALPNLPEYEDDEDYLSYRVRLLDWQEVYGEVAGNLLAPTRVGTLSRNDIMANFDGERAVNYKHLSFGCDVLPVVGQEGYGGIVVDVDGSLYGAYILIVAPYDLPPSDWDTAMENSRNFSLNGYDDWFLPSPPEIIKAIDFLDVSYDENYWTSWDIWEYPAATEAFAMIYSDFAKEHPDDWRWWVTSAEKDEIHKVRPMRWDFASTKVLQ